MINQKFLQKVVIGMKASSHAFTVEMGSDVWWVYKTTHQAKNYTLAILVTNKKRARGFCQKNSMSSIVTKNESTESWAVIGLFTLGHSEWTPEAVKKHLQIEYSKN